MLGDGPVAAERIGCRARTDACRGASNGVGGFGAAHFTERVRCRSYGPDSDMTSGCHT